MTLTEKLLIENLSIDLLLFPLSGLYESANDQYYPTSREAKEADKRFYRGELTIVEPN